MLNTIHALHSIIDRVTAKETLTVTQRIVKESFVQQSIALVAGWTLMGAEVLLWLAVFAGLVLFHSFLNLVMTPSTHKEDGLRT